MTDIVERLSNHAASDHKRGCQGRCYSCNCGFDNEAEELLIEAGAVIKRQRSALRRSMRGTTPVDLGDGKIIYLYQQLDDGNELS